MWTKFGILVQNDMPTAVIWSILKREVEFQYGSHLFFAKRKLVIISAMHLSHNCEIWSADRHEPSEESDVTKSEIGSKIALQWPPF